MVLTVSEIVAMKHWRFFALADFTTIIFTGVVVIWCFRTDLGHFQYHNNRSISFIDMFVVDNLVFMGSVAFIT